MKLNESGLNVHDLDYLILPLVEIDTFESKIDDDRAVVVAFYVVEQQPSKDLEIFIEKSGISIMDIESSPAPTPDGYYVVFLELERNNNMPKDLLQIIEDVNNLTNVDTWQFKSLGSDEIYDLTLDNLQQHLNLNKQAPSDLQEVVERVLKTAMMDQFLLEGDKVHISGPSVDLQYKVVEYGDSCPSIPILALSIGHELIHESQKLNRILGPNFTVEITEPGLLVQSSDGYLLLSL